MNQIAIDIETVGLDWDSLDSSVQNYLEGRSDSEEERREVPNKLGLNPGTGRVIAIGLWRVEENRGGVLIEDMEEGGDEGWGEFVRYDGPAQIFRGSEQEILEQFWDFLPGQKSTIITYNGRSFDGPFLMLRSALLDIEPTRNLVPYRYSFEDHCDLAEVISFYGARQMESLDFWCHQAGIESPKQEISGAEVEQAFEDGRIDEIAEYCVRDAKATAELYKVMEPIVDLMNS
jgi:DNA polymerase elongation subunit (family B)